MSAKQSVGFDVCWDGAHGPPTTNQDTTPSENKAPPGPCSQPGLGSPQPPTVSGRVEGLLGGGAHQKVTPIGWGSK